MARKKTKKNKHIVVKEATTTANKKVEKNNFYDDFIKEKELFLLLGILCVICFIVFKDFIFQKKLYLFRDIGSDSINDYLPRLVLYSEYWSATGVPSWSFAQGMGQDIFPLSFGNLFANVLMFFDKSQIPYGIAYVEIIKVLLSGYVFFLYLKEFKIDAFSAMLFSILFVFSGFMIVGGTWSVFSMEVLYMSVLLYGVERWLNHHKIMWLVIGFMSISFFLPALLFPYTIVLAPYLAVRYLDIHGAYSKQSLVFLGKTFGLALIGVLMASYQILPDILQILESPRGAGESSFFAKLQAQSVFGLADPLLRFTTVFRTFGADMLGNGSNFKGAQNYLEAPVFYCGIISIITFPQFFIGLNKKQQIYYGAFTLLLCLPIFFPYFRFAFWAFSGDYFRTFSLIITLILVLFSARALSFIVQKNTVNKPLLAISLLFCFYLLYVPNEQFKQAIDVTLRSYVAFLLVVYAILLYGLSSASFLKNISRALLLLMCVAEVTFFTYQTVNKRDVVTDKMMKAKVGYNDYSTDAVAYLKTIDSSFYRINKDYSSGLSIHSSINDNKMQDFYGTASYYSFNQPNYIKFLGSLDVINPKNENDTRWAKGLGGRPVLFSMASGKYWLTKRTDNGLRSFGLDSIASFGDVKVYNNPFAVNFGFTYDKYILEKDFMKLSTAQKDFTILRACVVQEQDQDIVQGISRFNLSDTLAAFSFNAYKSYTDALNANTLNISKFEQNNIVGTIKLKEPRILFFSMPFDKGWRVKINGLAENLNIFNAGLTGVALGKGEHQVELTFESRLRSEGAWISILSGLLFVGLLFYQKKRSA